MTYIDSGTPYGLTNGNYLFPHPGAFPHRDWKRFGERVLCFLGMSTARPLVGELIRRYIAVYIVQLRELVQGRYVSVYYECVSDWVYLCVGVSCAFTGYIHIYEELCV